MSLRSAVPLAAVLAVLLLPYPLAGALGGAEAGRGDYRVPEPTIVCIRSSKPPYVHVMAECGAARVRIEVTKEYVLVHVSVDCGQLTNKCSSSVLMPKPIYLPP